MQFNAPLELTDNNLNFILPVLYSNYSTSDPDRNESTGGYRVSVSSPHWNQEICSRSAGSDRLANVSLNIYDKDNDHETFRVSTKLSPRDSERVRTQPVSFRKSKYDNVSLLVDLRSN
jgi:hypothetical protein